MIKTGILKRDGYYDVLVNGDRVGSRFDFDQAIDYLRTFEKNCRVSVQLSLKFD